jgi:hypothetical protein
MLTTKVAPVILLVDCEERLLVDLQLLPELLDWRRKRREGTVLTTTNLASAIHTLQAIRVDMVVVAVPGQTSVELLVRLQNQALDALVVAIADDRRFPADAPNTIFATDSFKKTCPLCLKTSSGGEQLLREICRRAESIAKQR